MPAFSKFDDRDNTWKNIQVLNKEFDDEILQRYVTPGDPIAFSHPKTVFEAYNGDIPMKRINNILRRIRSATLHKEFHEGKRNISYSRFKRYQFQADLCFIKDLSRQNRGIKYLLTVIDCFTRYAFVRPLKNKKGDAVLSAFKDILVEAIQNPQTLVCDKGTEFTNTKFMNFCQSQNIRVILPQSNTHAAYVERFNRTIQVLIKKFCTQNKTKRYINNLQDLVKTYNMRKHRMINVSPYEAENNPDIQIMINNQITLREKKLKSQIPDLSVGSLVRISKSKDKFSRGYNQQSMDEVYKITSVDERKKIPLYYLTSNENGEEIEGGFYRFEITPVVFPEI